MCGKRSEGFHAGIIICLALCYLPFRVVLYIISVALHGALLCNHCIAVLEFYWLILHCDEFCCVVLHCIYYVV